MLFTAQLSIFDSDLWGYHLPVPAEVSDYFLNACGRRVIAELNGMHRYHCALMPLKGGGYFINVNKAARETLGIAEGHPVEVRLTPDDSPYGMPMSAEFEEVLRQDALSAKTFHALTPGRQRSLIYYADNVKSPEIKLRRAFVVMNHLSLHGTDVDFKVLNEEMKAANRAAKLR